MSNFIVSFLMILSVFVGQVSAASHAGIKNAFDELSYSLSVEWDQENMSFYQAQKAKFEQEVKAQGMTSQDLLDILNEEITDEQLKRDIVNAFDIIKANKMSQEEAETYLVNTLAHSYTEGAHWNPLSKVGLYLKTAGTVALAVVVIILFSQTGAFQGATF